MGVHPPLCATSIVAQTCAFLSGDGPDGELTSIQLLQAATTVQSLSLQQLWQVLGLTNQETVTCQKLCVKLTDYIGAHQQLPPSSDVACYRKDDAMVCDLDVSMGTLKENVNIKNLELPDLHDQVEPIWKGPPLEIVESDSPSLNEETSDSKYVAPTSLNVYEVACRLARLFRIYPSPGVTLVDVQGSGQKHGSSFMDHGGIDWNVIVQQRILEAQSYMSSVVKQKRADLFTKWFGADSYDNARVTFKIKETLNSIDSVLSNAEYVYPGAGCSKNLSYMGEGNWAMHAYVLPRVNTPNENGETTMNNAGKYLIYLCPHWVEEESASLQLATLLHEASHHATAYTEDVCAYQDNVLDRPRVPVSAFRHLPYIKVGQHISTSKGGKECVAEVRRVIGNWVDVAIRPGSYVDCPRAYGRKTCAELASKDPILAQENADNFAYYIEDVVSGP